MTVTQLLESLSHLQEGQRLLYYKKSYVHLKVWHRNIVVFYHPLPASGTFATSHAVHVAILPTTRYHNVPTHHAPHIHPKHPLLSPLYTVNNKNLFRMSRVSPPLFVKIKGIVDNAACQDRASHRGKKKLKGDPKETIAILLCSRVTTHIKRNANCQSRPPVSV